MSRMQNMKYWILHSWVLPNFALALFVVGGIGPRIMDGLGFNTPAAIWLSMILIGLSLYLYLVKKYH